MATGMFAIKNHVINLEGELSRINTQIKSDQRALHVLNAEWTYLNDPSRIRDLSVRHAGMKPIRAERIISFSAIPFRDAPAAVPSATRENGFIRVSYSPSATKRE